VSFAGGAADSKVVVTDSETVFVGGAAGEFFFIVWAIISAKAPKPPRSIPAPAFPNSSPLLADFSCAPNCKRSLHM